MLRRLALVALACASLQAQAHTSVVVAALNRLRAQGGACATPAGPLRPTPALDAAAAAVARGRGLAEAFDAAGYRAAQANVITIQGAAGTGGLEAFLASRYCAQLTIPQLTEAGVHEAGDRIWIVLAAPYAPGVGLTRAAVVERTLALVNRARAGARNCGGVHFPAAGPLRWNALLEQAAQLHADDMAANNYFSHAGGDGSTPAQRVLRSGYRYRATGENIASGQGSPEDAVSGWIASPAHCANLMNALFTEMGVAYAVNAASAMGVYWTQEFGKPL